MDPEVDSNLCWADASSSEQPDEQQYLPQGTDSLSCHPHLDQQQQQQQEDTLHHHQDPEFKGADEQLLVGGQPTAGVTPGTPGSASHGGNGGGSACCESGRPIVVDPVSGQSVCSCQYDPRLFSSYPRLSTYGATYPSADQSPYSGIDSSAFYSPLGNHYGLKDSTAVADVAWSNGLQATTSYYHPYDPSLAYAYPGGYDLAARRKNATRESTATLKSWLNEHKKNPYPTKGEKIMLAIITKMTLTQVSTWFANARRRLKKENKMTWEPKNKTDDDDDALASDGDEDIKDNRQPMRGMDHKMEEKGALMMAQHHLHHLHIKPEMGSMMLGDEDEDDPQKPLMLKDEVKSDCGVPIPATKPKIWSLADTAACKTPPPTMQLSSQPWLPPSNNNFALPASISPSAATAPYSRYNLLSGGYSGAAAGGHSACSVGASGFPEVQTDTPPQTPPNMKLPPGGGNSSGFGGQPQHPSQHQHHHMQQPPPQPPGTHPHPQQQQQPQQPPSAQQFIQTSYGSYIGHMTSSHAKDRTKDAMGYHSQHHIMMNGAAPANVQGAATEGSTAFKPFYKSAHPLSGYVSPV
ncbi:Hypothetical predicted protein [Cloeon dipterum]|uniref:Homeobox domain-containing protein n=1 Tax=Cloeon dipterum TaxID=197152 RepID=A0A8S1BYV6_9INSE|nr:Hypothetical predicted protein [Cloeon dipterum]